ncbi:MAG: host attachment family protein [Alkalilacustris sp.]
MALLAKGTWVLLADGEKALICENTGTTRAPRLRLHAKMAQDLAPQRELADDRPGRMPDPGKGQRSAMEAVDLNRLAKERFAAEVAVRVNRLAGTASVQRMVVAAPPQLLPVLREGLDPELRARVIAELPKTLTQHPLSQLGARVADLVDPL